MGHGHKPGLSPANEALCKLGLAPVAEKTADKKSYGFREGRFAPMPVLIKKLNETLRGWANYHRHAVASEVFSYMPEYAGYFPQELSFEMLEPCEAKVSCTVVCPAKAGMFSRGQTC